MQRPSSAGGKRVRVVAVGAALALGVAAAAGSAGASGRDWHKQAPTTIATSATPTATVGGSIEDDATVSGLHDVDDGTGSVTFTLYADPDCDGPPLFDSTVALPEGGQVVSGGYIAEAAGTDYWVASYSGDESNEAASEGCGGANESTTVARAAPTITASATPSASVGGSIQDSATLSGRVDLADGTDTVTFDLYGNAGCEGPALLSSTVGVADGGQVVSAPYTALAAGTDYWVASYSGGSANNAASTACGAAGETTEVQEATPSITTTLTDAGSGSALADGAHVLQGASLYDVATLSGVSGVPFAGKVGFDFFANGSCSGTPSAQPPATVSGSSARSASEGPLSSAGSYSFEATYLGDADPNYTNSAPSACEPFTIDQPAIAISQTPTTQALNAGASAAFTIAVSDSGTVGLSGVAVSDALAAGCARTIGALSPGQTVQYSCTSSGVASPFTNVATASGQPPVGPPVTASASAAVTGNPPPAPAESPALALGLTPATQTVTSGQAAGFTISVANTGNVTLTGVSVGDGPVPGCGAVIGTLAPGASTSYSCSLGGVTAAFTNLAVATGTPPAGPNVSASASAGVNVVEPFVPPTIMARPAITTHPPITTHPSITISTQPKMQTIPAGATASFVITVSNSGDVILGAVSVSDPLAAGCARGLGSLAAGAARSFSCTRSGLGAGFLNVATVSGRPPSGEPVSASDQSSVSVAAFVPPQRPGISIVEHPRSQTLTTEISTLKGAHGAVTTAVTYGSASFTITVTNTGNTLLTAVPVADALSPSCNRTIGTLAAGASRSYSCTALAVSRGFVNTAIAAAASPAGFHVKALAHAKVKLGRRH